MFYKEVHRILKPGGFLQIVELVNYTSEMFELAAPFVGMNRTVAILLGYGDTFSQNTWSLDCTNVQELLEGVDPESWEKLWSEVAVDKIITPITGWPEDDREKALGIGQALQVQLLFKGFRERLLDTNSMSKEEADGIMKGLENVLNANPPPRLSWGYNTYVARKPCS